MNVTDKVEFYILVSAQDSNAEDMDRLTRQLLSEIRETNVDSAELVRGEPIPSGTKSAEAVTIGSIVVSTLPSVLPIVIKLIQEWVSRGQGRSVKFRGKVGKDMIQFEGSPHELHKLIETLAKVNKI